VVGLVVIGITVFGKGDTPSEQPRSVSGPGSASAAPFEPLFPEARTEAARPVPSGGWQAADDLEAAIAATRPLMSDTTDRLDEGAARLALWASEHLSWSDLAELPTTSPALYRKDPAEEKGKRLCAEGTIEVVRAERNLARRLRSDHPLPLPAPPSTAETDGGVPLGAEAASSWDVPGGKVFFAVVDTRRPGSERKRPSDPDEEAPLVVSAIAVGSSGKLVDGDRARVCGVLTGVNLIEDDARSDVLAHRVVGMFDLPENRR
jgi:hypothetical protein